MKIINKILFFVLIMILFCKALEGYNNAQRAAQAGKDHLQIKCITVSMTLFPEDGSPPIRHQYVFMTDDIGNLLDRTRPIDTRLGKLHITHQVFRNGVEVFVPERGD